LRRVLFADYHMLALSGWLLPLKRIWQGQRQTEVSRLLPSKSRAINPFPAARLKLQVRDRGLLSRLPWCTCPARIWLGRVAGGGFQVCDWLRHRAVFVCYYRQGQRPRFIAVFVQLRC
jgi:hypothetical protein